MTGSRVIAVTGVSGYWGSRVAARLLASNSYHVLGLDGERPAFAIDGLDFVQADVRNRLLADLLRAERVELVCHLDFQQSLRPSTVAFDRNVVGTEMLLEACLEAGVRKVAIKSSTAVYGARPSNSAFLAEDHPLRGNRQYGYVRDLLQIEDICRGVRHRAAEMDTAVLRFANVVGPTANTPMTAFLTGSRTPTLLGFDPIIQLIHEQDVVEALVHVLLTDTGGVYNIAARDLLPLNRVRGLAGKSPLPMYHRWAYRGLGLLRRSDTLLGRYLPIEPDFLRYRCVADLKRMGDTLGFRPHFTAEEALREFARRRDRPWPRGAPSAVARDEAWLRDIMARRSQEAQPQTASQKVREGRGDDE